MQAGISHYSFNHSERNAASKSPSLHQNGAPLSSTPRLGIVVFESWNWDYLRWNCGGGCVVSDIHLGIRIVCAANGLQLYHCLAFSHSHYLIRIRSLGNAHSGDVFSCISVHWPGLDAKIYPSITKEPGREWIFKKSSTWRVLHHKRFLALRWKGSRRLGM